MMGHKHTRYRVSLTEHAVRVEEAGLDIEQGQGDYLFGYLFVLPFNYNTLHENKMYETNLVRTECA